MFARAFALAAALAAGTTLAAAAARPDSTAFHLMQPNVTAPTTTPTMLYFGGPVLPAVKVQAVYWGGAIAQQRAKALNPFLAAIVNSTFVDQLAQYSTHIVGVNGLHGTNQTISRGSYLGSATITPANTKHLITDGDIQTELLAQIAAGHLPPADLNTLYMIYFPSTVHILLGKSESCVAFGAYHSSTSPRRRSTDVYYGVMPDCGNVEFLTVASSHEFAEAISDPIPTPGSHPKYPQAWNTSGGYEIADLCQQYLSTLTVGETVFHVQEVFDNTTNACGTATFTSP